MGFGAEASESADNEGSAGRDAAEDEDGPHF